jgi:hypothetical protein
MIKMHIDLVDASAVDLAAFYEIPGMKEAIGALSTRGRELNVALTMTGGEAAVASRMSNIAAKLPPHIECDEYHKVGSPAHSIFTRGQPAPIYAAGVLVHPSTE